MSEVPTHLTVKIGRITVSVPVHVDEEQTLRLVDRLNRKLAEIEESSTRIDSQAFAIQLAYAFAVEAEEQKAARTEDEHEVIRRLSDFHDRLREIVRESELKS